MIDTGLTKKEINLHKIWLDSNGIEGKQIVIYSKSYMDIHIDFIYLNNYKFVNCSFSNILFKDCGLGSSKFINCRFDNSDFKQLDLGTFPFIDCIFVDCEFAKPYLSDCKIIDYKATSTHPEYNCKIIDYKATSTHAEYILKPKSYFLFCRFFDCIFDKIRYNDCIFKTST